jgi:hypothetical protein
MLGALISFIFENILTELIVFSIVRIALSKLILTDDCAAYLKSKCQYEYKFYLLNDRKNDIHFLEQFCTVSLMTAFIFIANVYVLTQVRYIEPGPVLSLFLSSRIISTLNQPSVSELSLCVLYTTLAYAKSRIIIFVLIINALEKVHVYIKRIQSLHELVVVERDTPMHENLVLCIVLSTKLSRSLSKVRRYIIASLVFLHIYLNRIASPSPKDYLIISWLCYQFSV